jgi:hypothetical protein
VDESTGADDDGRTGLRGRASDLRPALPARLRPSVSVFSLPAFLVVLALGAGAMVGGAVLPLPGVRFVLLFAATFGHGAVAARPRYVESAAAGALAAGTGFVLRVAFGATLPGVPAGAGAELGGVGVTAAALVAVAGHYFGRSLGG